MLLAAGIGDESVYLNRALEAYETLKAPDNYQKRKWGEALYKLGRYAEAEAIPNHRWGRHSHQPIRVTP